MRSLTVTAIILAVSCLMVSNAKQYMRCELCKELIQKYNFDKTFLSNWICMIEHESGRDTAKVTRKPNGSANYGIFQINSKGWCTVGQKGGICNAKCEGKFTPEKDFVTGTDGCKVVKDQKAY